MWYWVVTDDWWQGDICIIWGTADDAERRPCKYSQVGPWSEAVPAHPEGLEEEEEEEGEEERVSLFHSYSFANIWIYLGFTYIDDFLRGWDEVCTIMLQGFPLFDVEAWHYSVFVFSY